jgi:tRNA(adenine34) deaminase
MALALEEARAAAAAGETPVGALVVRGGSVVARRHNERQRSNDPTAHAELLAVRDASGLLGRWRLDDCTVFVTIEPCAMCAGALLLARVARLVFGAPDPKAGACGSLYNLLGDPRLNHEIPTSAGVRGEEAAALMTEFFAGRRGG